MKRLNLSQSRMFSTTNSSSKPLPLKQRTSSLDTRRDYSHSTWWSLLVLLKLREFIVTVDNFSIWRRHLAWAIKNGKDLRAYMTQRYGSSMVFMSLLLSTELSILFNSAGVTTDVRAQLREGNHGSVSFWAGFMIIVSAILTVLSLISLFTAWGMVNAIDEVNAHCIFRSSIGQYAAALPGRLIVCSIYTFLIAFMMFFFLLLPVGPWSILLLACTIFLFVHIVTSFSAFGRVIMHSGAMGNSRIFTEEYEDSLLPHSLHSNLLAKAQANLANNASIIRQYRRKQRPIDRPLTDEDLYDHLSGKSSVGSTIVAQYLPPLGPRRPRTDSIVRFADQDTSASERRPRPTTEIAANSAPTINHISLALDETSRIPASSLRRSSYNASTLLDQRPRPSASQEERLESSPLIPSPSSLVDTTLDSSRLGNVSNTSLEHWLRSSSNEALIRSNDISTSDLSANSHLGVIQQYEVGQKANTPTDYGGNVDSNVTQENIESRLRNTLASGISRLKMDDATLSEDERFMFDYGSFDGGRIDTSSAGLTYSNETTLDSPNSVPPHAHSSRSTTKASDTTPDEQESLLDRRPQI